jgi:hypothetical protein
LNLAITHQLNFLTIQQFQTLNFLTQDISKQAGDFDICNKIDPLAKIKDFSNIKLYNIHPKLKEQLVHRLKCLNLNVEELTKILKNL